MGRPLRRQVALLAAGILIAVAPPAWWWSTHSTPETVGAEAARSLAGGTSVPARSTPPSAPPVPTPAVPVRDGRLGRAGDAADPVPPTGLRLPSIGVTARVVPVGVTADRELAVPEDVRVAGWYRYGPAPGATGGSVVITGHVDSAEQGTGAFFRLRSLRPGDPVLVALADGRTWRYRVVAREQWPKSAVPLDRIFARGGAPRLTLVTCGGGFREDVRSYRDNVAVTAVPEGVS